MQMSIEDVLKLRKDFLEKYEFNKKDTGLFNEDRINSLKNIRGALKELDQQLKTIEVDFDLTTMHLSKFNYKDVK